MNKRLLLALLSAAALFQPSFAQRVTDRLGRGLVAVKTDKGVLCTWRINADEWNLDDTDNISYKLYRGDTEIASGLEVSNFLDAAGTTSDTYSVRALRGSADAGKSEPVKVWEKNYTVIKPKHAPDIKAALVPNDATVADVDGDGDLEILMKYDQTSSDYHNGDNGIFTVVECLEMDGSVKWWINFGPNIGDFQNNEINIIATDWDGDGRAEVVFRAADGTVIHMADGTDYTVGDASINYRGTAWPDGQWFMHWGREYLVYADGLTGKPYECIDYPLVRVPAENNPSGLLSGGSYDKLVENEWGDGYGHRSSKYFFAAPYLDGRKPSLFLARGIYTKHKMIAYDIDPATHKLIERWRWNDLGGAWWGQGYHNFGIADVDWDGRDEIVYGSMVIDDNGYGLSTTGLGHGDAQHCGDFDPYTHGQEIFCCNEDNPNNNFRDATTSKIYYRTTGGNDDGRSNMGNFIDEYPGAEGISSRDNALIGGASHNPVIGDTKSSVSITQNFRVYWDGDLCDESFDYSNGKNTAGAIYKARQGRIALLEGSKTNNDTKGTPCFQGDILGDWREEYIMRDADNNIRIYTTDFPTEHRLYSLWYDHQYRNAMNWQMCGYNQPPHVSFHLSQFEGMAVPPPPSTMTGRVEIPNGGRVTKANDNQTVIICETNDMTVDIDAGAAPRMIIVNTPTWVEGHNNNNYITTKTFTHKLTGPETWGRSPKIIKQGDGILDLSGLSKDYAGKIEAWAGTVQLAEAPAQYQSDIWLNRFGTLETGNRSFGNLEALYGSTIRIMDKSGSEAGTVTADRATLGFGSVLEIRIHDGYCSRLDCNSLAIDKKDWQNGPEYLRPVIRFIECPAEGKETVAPGRYPIGNIGKIEAGSIDDLIIEGMDHMKKVLAYENGSLYLDLFAYEPGEKTWAGGEGMLWDLDNSTAFKGLDSDGPVVFVPGDDVIFDDTAAITDVVIAGRLKPASVTFRNNDKDYTLSGEGQIVGDTKLVKEGNGNLTVSNINAYTGGTYINGGKLTAGVFSNDIGTDLGALSDLNSRIFISNGATLAANATATLGQKITLQKGNGVIEVADGKELTTAFGIYAAGVGQTVTKRGKGTLTLGTGSSANRLIIEEGVVNANESADRISLPATVEFVKGSLYDPANIYTYSTNPTNYVVGKGNSGSLYLDSRCSYTGKLTGEGTLTVYASGPRTDLKGNWADFAGTLVANQLQRGSYGPDFKWDNTYGMPKATLSIASGITFNAQGYDMKLAALKGSGTYNGTGTLTIGNDNTTISFTGSFAGKPKIVKTGKCDWNITKLVSDISEAVVNDGTISLSASSSPYNTVFFKNPLTITGDALLRGRGTVSDLTVTGNATLQPGYFSASSQHHYGAVIASGNVTVDESATLSLYLRYAGKGNDCSYLNVQGKLTVNGKVVVTMNPAYVPKEGDQFQLWVTGNFAGKPQIELPELPYGYFWDATGLKDATGILKVTVGAGIETIADSETVSCRIFDYFGNCLGNFESTKAEAAATAATSLNLTPGLYILTIEAGGRTETVKLKL